MLTQKTAAKMALEQIVDCENRFYHDYLDYCSALELDTEEVTGKEQSNHIYSLALQGLGLSFPERFERVDDADISGTSLMGEISATYGELAEVLGKASGGDDYKVSGEWTFVSTEGEVFNVYDWKETSLYDSDLPSVQKFRKSTEPVMFHVGARRGSDVVGFIKWLKKKLS
jgi:hypothetical protein